MIEQLNALSDGNLSRLTELKVIHQRVNRPHGGDPITLIRGFRGLKSTKGTTWMTKVTEMEALFGDCKEQLFSEFRREDETYPEFMKRLLTPPPGFGTDLLQPGHFEYTVRNRVCLYTRSRFSILMRFQIPLPCSFSQNEYATVLKNMSFLMRAVSLIRFLLNKV